MLGDGLGADRPETDRACRGAGGGLGGVANLTNLDGIGGGDFPLQQFKNAELDSADISRVPPFAAELSEKLAEGRQWGFT